jgi:hypothetical protein
MIKSFITRYIVKKTIGSENLAWVRKRIRVDVTVQVSIPTVFFFYSQVYKWFVEKKVERYSRKSVGTNELLHRLSGIERVVAPENASRRSLNTWLVRGTNNRKWLLYTQTEDPLSFFFFSHPARKKKSLRCWFCMPRKEPTKKKVILMPGHPSLNPSYQTTPHHPRSRIFWILFQASYTS